LYQWWGPKPPRQIIFRYQDHIVVLPGVVWKKRRLT
jgi:hypothetical protein